MVDGVHPPRLLRLDRWLWHARLMGSRQRAERDVRRGSVVVQRRRADGRYALIDRVRPGMSVQTSDIITLRRRRQVLQVEITDLPLRRVSPEQVSLIYRMERTLDLDSDPFDS